MTRYVLLAFLCLGASISRAEDLPGGASVEFGRLFIHPNNDPALKEPETEAQQWQYFNYAHCTCSQSNGSTPIAGFNEFEFGIEILVKNLTTPIDTPIELWAGTSCADEMLRPNNCEKVGTTENITVVSGNNGVTKSIPVFNFMSPKTVTMESPTCNEVDVMQNLFALADSDMNASLDYSVSKPINIDTKAPDQPTNYRVAGAENAIEISWTPPADTSDVYYYQAFCAKVLSQTPGKDSGRPAPRYQSGKMLCNNTDVPFFLSMSLDNSTPDSDAGTGVMEPPGWSDGDPIYLCAENGTPTAQGIRIEGLENGTEYLIGVLVMDQAGNAQGTHFTTVVKPQPATDFWEDLHDQGSDVEGGFCLLSQTYGDSGPLTGALRSFRDNTLADTFYGRWLVDVYYGTIGRIDLHGSLVLRIVVGIVLLPLVVLALLWHLLTLPGLLGMFALLYLVRRRKLVLARVATASTIAVIALVPTRAHAQSPYWEHNDFTEPQSDLPPGDPERVHWHAGIRLGPYVPGIDAQLGMPVGKYDGPYEQMFGGYSILPMLDVDYFFLRGFGQFGVGASLGYMGKKERAWLADSDPMDPDRQRSSGDWNKFRLFPFSINAVYRFTYLDDNYGVPVVPYARGGLAYYVWWITAPNGDFAKSCVGPNTSTDCAKTTAAGASLGVVGSVGLALRAERVDASAARSMRESGIEHAGFYAEYSIGKVDGFGSDKKLSVGAATWFAGVDFEF
jgi:hypothetical protein